MNAEGIATGQVALDESLIDDRGAVPGFAGRPGVAGVEIAAGEDRNAEGREKRD